ncbi:MAG: hypothetical protein AB7H80_07740 [Candidatus Kapaibacterium sp.]
MEKRRFDDIPSVPHFDEHMWIDYFELLCLANVDRTLDAGSIIDRFRLKEEDSIDASLEESTDLTNEDKDYADFTSDPQRKYERMQDEFFKHFRARELLFNAFYPFTVEGSLLKKKPSVCANKTVFYIYLLCCSWLKYFKDYMSTFTSDFERISTEALKSLVPSSAEIRHFGKTLNYSHNQAKGNIYKKLSFLSQEMATTLRISESDLSPFSSGDGGIDIVSWFNFGDAQNNTHSFAAQCKCSNDWSESRNPSDLMTSYLNMDHEPNSIYFIPFSYRKTDKNWHQPQKVKGRIVVDRFRLCQLLKNDLSFFSTLNSYDNIIHFLEETEPII